MKNKEIIKYLDF